MSADVGKELLNLAHDRQDPADHMVSHLTLGGALFFCLSEFVSASEHLEHGATLYDPYNHRSYTSLFAADLGALCSALASGKRSDN